MTTLRVGIASHEVKRRTMAVARGERRVEADAPKVWCTSTESFAKVLSPARCGPWRITAWSASNVVASCPW